MVPYERGNPDRLRIDTPENVAGPYHNPHFTTCAISLNNLVRDPRDSILVDAKPAKSSKSFAGNLNEPSTVSL